MARPPPGGSYGGSSQPRNDLLLDLENEQPIYSGGQRSNLNDDDLLRSYTLDQETAQGRPSVSYDDFVGAGQTTHPSAKRPPHPPPGPSTPSDAPGPGNFNRQYSQTSELGN